MVDSTPQLTLTLRDGATETHALTADQINIGRSAGNDIVINDPELSRQHARLTRQADGYTLRDMGSTNGTFVHGRRLTGSHFLQDGDVISLGETVQLTYRTAAPQTAVPSVPIDEQPTLYDPNFAPPTPAPPFATDDPQALPQTSREPTEVLGLPPELAPDDNRRRWVIGCGCGALIVIALCLGLFILLDAYQQGRLLYCGGLRPFWELVLGPFGFAPICP